MEAVESSAYLARQPILDVNRNVFAYELLFRNSPENSAAVIQDGVRETAQILENVLNNIGLSRLVGNHRAFINCSREMLLDDIFGPLDPERFVLEILEDVPADDAVIAALKNYRARGFELALDDVVFEKENLKRLEPFFPLVKYVKMDLIENYPEELEQAVAFFKSKGIILLAEKVETHEEFRRYVDLGYELFQGYYFSRPEVIHGKRMDGSLAVILNLIQFLRGEPSLAEMEDAFRQEPLLARNLIRFVNSQKAFRRHPVENIQDAIAWLGCPTLQDWLMLLLYAQPEMGRQLRKTALFQNVSQRAKFLEALAKKITAGEALSSQAFLLGIVSRMDALVREPMPKILAELEVDKEISAALLHGSGKLGTLLALAEAVENKRSERLEILMKRLSLSKEDIQECLDEARGLKNG